MWGVRDWGARSEMVNRCVNQLSWMFQGVGVMVLVAGGVCACAQTQTPVGEGPGGIRCR
jgi:hypothetical protein